MRAQIAEEVMRERLDVLGIVPRELRFAYVGINSLYEGWEVGASAGRLREVMLHAAGRFDELRGGRAFAVEFHMGAGNHYGPAGGTSGRSILPPDDTPTCYTTLIPRDLLAEPELMRGD